MSADNKVLVGSVYDFANWLAKQYKPVEPLRPYSYLDAHYLDEMEAMHLADEYCKLKGLYKSETPTPAYTTVEEIHAVLEAVREVRNGLDAWAGRIQALESLPGVQEALAARDRTTLQ